MKALSLDDSLADAHNVLADIKASFEWDWDGAEREWKRALELKPNLAITHYFYAIFLTGQRRNEEALYHAERALELDPFTPTTVFYVIAVYGLVRQHDRAMALAKESLSLFPNDPGIHFWLSLLYHFKGMTKEAFAEYQKLIELGLPPNSINLSPGFKDTFPRF